MSTSCVLRCILCCAAFAFGPENGRMALKQFYQSAAERTGIRQTQWEQIVADGSQKEVLQTQQQLQLLADGCVDYLMMANHHLIQPGSYSTPGFCGHLNRYFDPATLALEGIKQL